MMLSKLWSALGLAGRLRLERFAWVGSWGRQLPPALPDDVPDLSQQSQTHGFPGVLILRLAIVVAHIFSYPLSWSLDTLYYSRTDPLGKPSHPRLERQELPCSVELSMVRARERPGDERVDLAAVDDSDLCKRPAAFESA